MPETYPDDATLLARAADDATGVDYIPTGQSPYYLHFRRMLDRLLRVAERANDLRPYRSGDLTVGVRPGRCTIRSAAIDFAGIDDLAVAPDATTHLWLDDAGALHSATTRLPADPTSHLPVAQVVAGPVAIESLLDLRGQTMLAVPASQAIGLTATVEQINRALDGASEEVTAAALSLLCDGPTSVANSQHTHTQLLLDTDGQAGLLVMNTSEHADAGIAIGLALVDGLEDAGFLALNRDTGFLQQRYLGESYNLLGAVHLQHVVPGDITTSLTDRLIGVVPCDGYVGDVSLTLGGNVESTMGTDGITATVRINGAAVCSTDPALTAADGAGRVSTARGDGTPAVVATGGVEQVTRGDVLTVDLMRTAGGTVSVEARDAVVLIVLRNAKPQ